MLSRIIYFILIFSLVLYSCRSQKGYQKQDSYQEISDINVHQRPKTIAKEIGDTAKKQKKAYRKQLKKAWKRKNPGRSRRENPYIKRNWGKK